MAVTITHGLPTRFENLADLARLPFFEVKDGRLVLADRRLGPAIDLHTHLALTYLVPQRLDLDRHWPETEHYLPKTTPIDLDVYVNKNFLAEDLPRMERDLSLGSLSAGGMRRTHTIPNLLKEMGELGIEQSVLLPIDFAYGSDNAGTWLKASKGKKELLCFGSVHPLRHGMEQNLLGQKALGARGIKVHPAVQMLRPDAARAMKLYRLCGKHQLPVLFHCGPVEIETKIGRYCSQVRFYEKAISENPDTLFILGHSGALQMGLAFDFAKKYGNVVLELSSQSLGNVRKIMAEADPDRIVFGSDWPFYHQGIALAKVLMASDDDELRKKVLRGNARRIFGLGRPG